LLLPPRAAGGLRASLQQAFAVVWHDCLPMAGLFRSAVKRRRPAGNACSIQTGSSLPTRICKTPQTPFPNCSASTGRKHPATKNGRSSYWRRPGGAGRPRAPEQAPGAPCRGQAAGDHPRCRRVHGPAAPGLAGICTRCAGCPQTQTDGPHRSGWDRRSAPCTRPQRAAPAPAPAPAAAAAATLLTVEPSVLHSPARPPAPPTAGGCQGCCR
jgi:hypothetical protein